jgi:hypothetical protein
LGALEDPTPPPIVAPGATSSDPPADAIVLFDGKDVSGWEKVGGGACAWQAKDGELHCKPGTGSIVSKETFQDAQIHVEFATPLMPDAKGQGRGNSGVYIQGRYEVQILDSVNNDTYADGQCGAVYKQYVPLVNVCRPPLQWQTYDMIFRAARGNKPATLTVFHNGVLIHDHIALKGPTPGGIGGAEGSPGPLLLQDHGNLVRFRNIWIRKLASE